MRARLNHRLSVMRSFHRANRKPEEAAEALSLRKLCRSFSRCCACNRHVYGRANEKRLQLIE